MNIVIDPLFRIKWKLPRDLFISIVYCVIILIMILYNAADFGNT